VHDELASRKRDVVAKAVPAFPHSEAHKLEAREPAARAGTSAATIATKARIAAAPLITSGSCRSRPKIV